MPLIPEVSELCEEARRAGMEMTPEMLTAGVLELSGWDRENPQADTPEEIVTAVFVAMRSAQNG